MVKIPEEPDRYIHYCVVLLPGFLILGTVLHVTEHALSEFAFTYIAVTLSVLVYFLVALYFSLWRWLRTRRPGQPAAQAAQVAQAAQAAQPADLLSTAAPGRTPGGAAPLPAAMLATALVSAAVAAVAIMAINTDTLLSALRSFTPLQIDRVSTSEPLLYLLRHEKQLHDIDARPVWSRANQRVDSDGLCVGAPYAAYARITVDDTVYEGRVSHFNGQPGKQGFPLLLSPACRVDKGEVDSFEPIQGPGVVIFGDELKSVELREMYASGCWKRFNPKASPPVRCREK